MSEKSSVKSVTADFENEGKESELSDRKTAFSVRICDQILSIWATLAQPIP